ncbi:extracellular solute-binding protein [Solihabitans fulvus]|uniref:Extracellular solute-binding protein n=1 Tax=Solihabitans fulvus TaxID=1892852 RepID=A0A5B2XGZ0_9PSEU|nr:extracellular solute-binding protein [Solihabitans fulvus]KAA2262444.1 extracellular solute-binding protein [Solihabitans fulvus]
MRVVRVLLAAAVGALALAGCAPVQSGSTSSAKDEKSGQLKVWLFDEVNRGPKEEVVKQAVSEFQAAHAGVTVDVQYIQVSTRAERFKAAFSDAKSAPDVAEFGNTDLAGYVAAGGFADLGQDVAAWSDGKDLSPRVTDTAKVDGKTYGVPWYVGIRALFYRTDVFAELGIAPPATLDDIAATARRIRAAKPDLLGISVGGKYTYGMLPFLWAQGGDLAAQQGGKFKSTVDSAEARAGIAKYTELLRDDSCPPAQCAGNGGDASVEAFRAGKAAMTIGGNFNRTAVDSSAAAGKYAIVPLPGKTAGSIAPAFAGGNLLGVTRSTDRRTLAVQFVELLGGKQYQQKMYQAMGNLPTFTDLQNTVAAEKPVEKPFIDTLNAGTRFVPVTPGWAKVDAQGVLPTMLQQVASGAQDVNTATAAAAQQMNSAFGS